MLGFASLWLETLGVLVALGLVGGWVLWPFRRPDRPFLALAAPLAGLATLGVSLEVLYLGLHATIPVALAVGFASNAALTLWRGFRGGRARRTDPSAWPWLVAAGGLVAAWGALSCSLATIRAGEPTVVTTLGTDTYGYAMMGDWLRTHAPDDVPALDPRRPLECLPHAFWCVEFDRPAAFFLVAAASAIQGTSALFVCDRVFGVALAAAILGSAGALARDRRALLLLVLGASTCGWLVTARTGYLGKTLCYPGTLLLAVVFVELVEKASLVRCLSGLALGLGVGATLHPSVSAGMLASAFAGVSAAAFVEARGWPAPRALLVPAGHFVLLCAPRSLIFIAQGGPWMEKRYPVSMDRAAMAALDLDGVALLVLDPTVSRCVLAGALLVTAAIGIAALPRRRPAALLACAGLLPLAFATGNTSLFAFHGLLYPFSLGGAVLLHEELRGRPRARRVLLVVIALSILARLPHASAFVRHVILDYTWRDPDLPVRESEVAAIRRAVGGRAADIVGGDPYFVVLLQTELGLRGSELHPSPASWRFLMAKPGLPTPAMFPKSPLSIVRPGQWTPPESVLHRSAHAVVVADHGAVSLRSILAREVPDERGRTVQQVGAARVELWNGSGAPAPRVLATEAQGIPPHPLSARRILVLRAGGGTSTALVPAEATTLRFPLLVPPGLSWLELEARLETPARSADDEALVQLGDLRLERAP